MRVCVTKHTLGLTTTRDALIAHLVCFVTREGTALFLLLIQRPKPVVVMLTAAIRQCSHLLAIDFCLATVAFRQTLERSAQLRANRVKVRRDIVRS